MMTVDCSPGTATRRRPAGDVDSWLAQLGTLHLALLKKKNWFFLMKTALECGRAWARAVGDPQGRRPPIVYSEQPPHALSPARPTAQSGSGAAVLAGRACLRSSWALLPPPAPGGCPRSVFQTKSGVCVWGGGGTRWRRWPKRQKVPRRRPSPGREQKGSLVLPVPVIICGRLAESPADLCLISAERLLGGPL